ncbi:hypothetical protein ASZ78_016692 [Callipepla squamata]|uniref:Sushi domain-containing protein n=1 Tax=Callipepla squamata TaxID=9009 RepID=A0A226NL78_CALSU|nr:hypothetical protein ASZ78_016692 [Callipepla squamata]
MSLLSERMVVAAACEESPPRRVKEVPTETWNNPPYPHGTLVTYKCRPGYMKIGRIVVKCADGVWKKEGNTECRSKPCGHPGDTEFGSFQLTAGNEFVFGARVEYRCNDGYQMLSQKNYRECLAEGWSNDIPHCEVAKCLPVKAPENGRIVVSGAFELNQEYSFGQAVEFECNERYKLVGSKAIHCSSNGKWDSDVPQCQEVVCFPPTIRNGNYSPQKDRYTEGATITVDCDLGYRFSTLTARNIAKCTSSGWVPAPGCVEKPCDYPAVENIRLNGYTQPNYFPMRIGQSIYYYCAEGYVTPNEENWSRIVCSQGGWKPEPKCLKKCVVSYLENGHIQNNWKRYYKEGERTKYFCYTNYRTENEGGQITCSKNGWSPTPKCIHKETCQVVDLRNGYFMDGKTMFDLGEKVTYRCYNDFVTPERQETGEIRCQKNGWSPPPKCIQSCKTSHIHSLIDCVRENVYLPGDILEYACPEKYRTADYMPTGTTRCDTNGEWKPAPRCVAIECELPVQPDSDVYPKKGRYYNGDVVKFNCPKNSVRVGPASAQCYYFGWFPPPPTCKVNPRGCGPPPEITNGNITGGFLEQYQHGNRVQYECDNQFKLVGSKETECLDGQWSPPPSCIDPPRHCVPPEGIVIEHTRSSPRQGKETRQLLKYRCKPTDRQIKQATCVSGKWSPEIQCTEKPCLPPQPVEYADDFRLVNQNLKIEKEGKTVYLAGAIVKFTCRSGFELVGPSEISCSMGNWSLSPMCSEMSCGSIPNVPNSAIEGRNKEEYEPGETVRYQCNEGFEAVGLPEIICRRGNWSAPPFCEDMTCEPPPEIAGGKVQGVKKSRYLPGETAEYQCWQGFQMTGASTVSCQNGNWTKLPTCKGKSGKCGPPPDIENGDILSFPLQEYPQGATLAYKCPNLYILEGSQEITCINGQWTDPPVCLASEEDMNRNNIELKWRDERKLYSTSGDTIEFECKIGYVQDSASSLFRVQCINGTLEYPLCKPGKDCTVLESEMEENNIKLESSKWKKPYTYRSWERISFACKYWYYKAASRPETFNPRCLDGVIEYPQCARIFG